MTDDELRAENERLREALRRVMDETGTSSLAHHAAHDALREQHLIVSIPPQRGRNIDRFDADRAVFDLIRAPREDQSDAPG